MADAEEHIAATRGLLSQRRLDNEEIRLMEEFLKWCKFPTMLKSRYYDTRIANPVEGVTASRDFLTAFPSFPMRVLSEPLKKAKECTRLDHLQGASKGGELRSAYERRVESNMDAVQQELPIVMLLRLPYMKDPHVYHNVDPVAGRFFEHEGNFFAQKSRFGYWMTLQPLNFFVGLPCIRDSIQEYFGNALAGRP